MFLVLTMIVTTRPIAVQAIGEDASVFIFYTGANPELLSDPEGIRDVLEDPGITKVLHASTMDIITLSHSGVRVWGMVDTCNAQLLVNYQRWGTRINSQQDSFNLVCTANGLRPNPFKVRSIFLSFRSPLFL